MSNINRDELPSIQEQQDIIDSWRNTHLTDTVKVKQEIMLLVQIRENSYSQFVIDCAENSNVLYKNYNSIFKYIISLPASKQKELFPDSETKEDPNYFSDKNVSLQNYTKLKDHYCKTEESKTYLDTLVKKLFDFKLQYEDELKQFAKKEFVYSSTTFPQLVSLAITYEMYRIHEFKEILEFMIENITKVQNGEITQKECTENILQKELANRFFKGN